jgi:hypothetical protein
MSNSILAPASLILLCFSMAAALGGGLFEHVVFTRLWSAAPPSSFTIIQPATGVPLQRFWIPVHIAITLFSLSSLVLAWSDRRARLLIVAGLVSYLLMRAWSGMYFIPEMLSFQKIAPGSAPSPELLARVARWKFWTWFREPLDLVSFHCWLLALFWLKRP